MTRRTVLCSIVLLPAAAQQRKSKDKGPEVELLDAAAHVEDNRINIDGHVKNVGERSIRKLTIIYEVLDSDRNVLTRQQGPIDVEQLEPGEESRFEAQMAYHARSVSFRIEFEDGSGRELRAEKKAPFPIE